MLSISVAAIELTSCHQEPEATSASPTLANDADSLLKGKSFSYLALGDSYTVGESVSESDRWPVQLANQLAALLPSDTLSAPTILAATGWTTNNLSQALTSSGYEDETWDYVSLLIGVNNQYQGLALEQYEVEFSDLLITEDGEAELCQACVCLSGYNIRFSADDEFSEVLLENGFELIN